MTLHAFLGHTSWCPECIPNNASVVEPLRAVLCQNASMVWSQVTPHSLETIKQFIMSRLLLTLFDPSLPTIVTTDASGYGLGAILT